MSKEETIKEIKKQITEKIRPALVMDGGNIEFVDYNDGVVKVKLLGHCHGCPMAGITLKNAVFGVLKEYIPEIKEVIAIDFDPEETEEDLEV
ncbi:MAG TPA: NifU family protein [Rickettsiales bacterium]|nr:NifU family protein [Rickettsiales bacterium]